MTLRMRNSFWLEEDIAALRDRVFRLLGQNGVRMDHPYVLERLEAQGARVDRESRRVRFPAEVLERALQSAPRRFTLPARDPARDLELPRADGSFHVRSNTGAPFFLDPETGEKRSVTIGDVGAWVRLADALDGVDFVPFPSPGDVPPQTADVHALRAVLENTRKHAWVQPYSAESMPYLLRLAAAAVGGDEALSRRPPVSFITCSLTPLDFKFMDLEVMFQACPLGVPVHACSLPGAGTTAPMTVSGTILLAAAEILAMVAVAQTLKPGAPVVGTPLVFFGDMATGASLQSSVEAMQGKVAAAQFVKAAFGIPVHTYGFGSDGPAVEGQSMLESGLLAALAASGGVDILGGAGQLEVATAVSPLQLVADDEVARMLRRTLAKPALDDDALAWAELLAMEPGGAFLGLRHTFRHCRDAHRPGLLIRDSMKGWEEKGKKDIVERARERCRELAAVPREPAAPEEVRLDLAEIVRAADADLGG